MTESVYPATAVGNNGHLQPVRRRGWAAQTRNPAATIKGAPVSMVHVGSRDPMRRETRGEARQAGGSCKHTYSAPPWFRESRRTGLDEGQGCVQDQKLLLRLVCRASSVCGTMKSVRRARAGTIDYAPKSPGSLEGRHLVSPGPPFEWSSWIPCVVCYAPAVEEQDGEEKGGACFGVLLTWRAGPA